jgi:hypothetical protein
MYLGWGEERINVYRMNEGMVYNIKGAFVGCELSVHEVYWLVVN